MKELKVKVSKIFNWPQELNRVTLFFEFYSDNNMALLATRMARATLVTNYLDVGVNFCIKFTPE